MSSIKVALIFGAGANTGLTTVKKFASGGYRVAAVSRHPSEELEKYAQLVIRADVNDPTQIEDVFENVAEELGPPHVVIYNGEFQAVSPSVADFCTKQDNYCPLYLELTMANR